MEVDTFDITMRHENSYSLGLAGARLGLCGK